MRKVVLRCLPIFSLLAALPAGCTLSVNSGDEPGDGGISARPQDSAVSEPDASVADGGGDSATVDDDGGNAGRDAGRDAGDAGTSDTFVLSGTATYDYVRANDGITETGPKLDYGAKTTRPIRRAKVFAMEGNTVVAESATDDLGAFRLEVPNGKTVTLRVAAQSVSTGNLRDGTAPDRCDGAKWDVKVVDNTSSDAQYMIGDTTGRSAGATDIELNAPLTRASDLYTQRAAAPFALLDTIIRATELVCQAKANVVLPPLLVKWSVNNINIKGDAATGQIGTSHYSSGTGGVSALEILGTEDVDTDEFDDHVIAHEYGHYLEDRLFRSDAVGDAHSAGDVLYPSVAFGEGFGNAFAGMTFDDPVYVDTNGLNQAQGYAFGVDVAPTGDDRGVYSETSVQYMLWKLFENRNSSVDRIFNILLNFQRTTPGLTSALTFGAYYNQVYGGSAESLQTIWEDDLASPFDSFCSGTCTGSGDTADVFDVDNDIGVAYAGTRNYPGETGAGFGANFWRLSRLLSLGTNAPTAHDQTHFGSYTTPGNKFGAQRAYRYVSTAAGPLTISVGGLGGAASCTEDVLDLKVALLGKEVAKDQASFGSTAGCPSVTFSTEAGKTYTIVVNGLTTEIPSYTVSLARKDAPPFRIAAAVPNQVAEETDVPLPFVVTPTRDVTNLVVSVRGVAGVKTQNVKPIRIAHPAVDAGVAHSSSARVARGAAGFVVVDVSATFNGRRVSASYPFQLTSKTAYAGKSLGALSVDSNGQRVELMKAVVR